jgi:anti-sigma-K factor RskA
MEHEERQFEREMTSQDRLLHEQLSDAMAVSPPEGLSDRITAASQSQLLEACDVALEQQLDDAFTVAVPIGLASRVYDASVDELCVDHKNVLAQIHASVVWRQAALAACVAFAVLIAVRFGHQPVEAPHLQPPLVSNAILSVEDVELLFEDLHLSEYAYLADTRELEFADIAAELNSLRDDIELWQYGLLTE